MAEFGDNMTMIGSSNSFGYIFFTFMVVKIKKPASLPHPSSEISGYDNIEYLFSSVSKVKIFEKGSNFSFRFLK